MQCGATSSLFHHVQDSIKSSSSWFLACRGEAAGLANMMLHRVQQMPDFSAQLHVLYLINDILFATCASSLNRSYLQTASLYSQLCLNVPAMSIHISHAHSNLLSQMRNFAHMSLAMQYSPPPFCSRQSSQCFPTITSTQAWILSLLNHAATMGVCHSAQ